MAEVQSVIGVDVGGTNTDAVILDQQATPFKVLSQAKSPTTVDVNTGVRNAVLLALKNSRAHATKLSILQVNIGTTHFINAVIEGKELVKTSVIRLCGTASRKLPPFSDFPEHLAEKIRGRIFMVDGGYQFDGQVIKEVDETEIVRCLNELKKAGEKNIVVSGIFSPVRPNQELQVQDIIRRHYPEASVTVSHVIGQIGLLERENAAIINECIKPLCQETISGFRKAFKEIGLMCPMFLTQNDGTLISEENALQYPVHTFASGATNSMRGAAFLSGFKDALVIDIGGTSTDVGILANGFPREASTEVKVGGIRTNFRMPDVVSIGLGGGSYVDSQVSIGGNPVQVSVGPLSAGFRLRQEAYVFGAADLTGRVLTATDIAVAAGFVDIGQTDSVRKLDPKIVEGAIKTIQDKMSVCIDQMRFNGRDLPLVVVGGGSILVDPKAKFAGVSEIVKPQHFDVANAIGAALSQVSASEDTVVNLEEAVDQDLVNSALVEKMRHEESSDEKKKLYTESIRKEFLAKARATAIAKTLEKATEEVQRAGGDPNTVYIVDKSDTALAYIPGGATRIKVKVAADLKLGTDGNVHELDRSVFEMSIITEAEMKKQDRSTKGEILNMKQQGEATAKGIPVEPTIDPVSGEWILSEYDIECLSIGAGILGTGGGGNPHLGKLMALKALREGKKIRVVSPDRFEKTVDPENDLIVLVAYMGAPAVMYEKLMSGTETSTALQCMQDLYSVGKYVDGELNEKSGVDVKTGDGISFIDDYKVKSDKGSSSMGQRRIAALMSAEIGGMNSIEPLVVGAELDLPVLDCDGMGRAFPELQMFAPFIYGCNSYPSTIGDDKGRRAVSLYSESPKKLENYFRNVVVSMGCSGGTVLSNFTISDVKKYTVQYSMSHAWRLGDTVLRAREESESPVDAVVQSEAGKLLIFGKITDIKTEITGGFNRGFLRIEGLDQFSGQQILIEFQNEFLLARRCDNQGSTGEILACVPDLITLLDPDTAQPIPTEEVRFGVRVSVLATAGAPLMKTEQALKCVGPQAFGYPEDIVYKPVAEFVQKGPVGPV